MPASFGRDQRVPPTPIIEAHYIANHFFLEPGELLVNAGRLKGIPGAIIQGRYDLLCPPVTAYALAAAWPGASLQIIDERRPRHDRTRHHGRNARGNSGDGVRTVGDTVRAA